ncbi:hydrolase TatD [Xanthomonas citri pv. malvacearum]|uniref:Qat anti-phage system TatD family nuclease QatD n=1 Tax=Xanthomonas TaxID=338 RepID=UPI0005293E19|nr:Qat anti-phage system TatD family nuclease QatD [Xanthomonas citri]AOL19859.1 hydrolase TatD [Xanthomonas citri pv. malvacearum]ASY89130.1 TatD family deoxyribonuclease [Xanthomonas citri pv. malvacearum]
MIDFHCHLDLYADPRQVVSQCVERGLYVLSVTTTPSAWEGTSALAGAAPRIRTSLGLHPQIAHERKFELPLFEKLIDRVRYVGEIGLDGSPELKQHWHTQLAVFEQILDLCEGVDGRVMSLHSRRATKAVLDMLEKHPKSGVPILHWFSGTQRELDRAVEMGCWFSVGPAMLRGEKGRKLAAAIPQDRILTESDGPFAKMDSRSIWPWEAAQAVVSLAEIWQVNEQAAATRLKANLKQIGES